MDIPRLLTWGVDSYAPFMVALGILAVLKTYTHQLLVWLEVHFS